MLQNLLDHDDLSPWGELLPEAMHRKHARRRKARAFLNGYGTYDASIIQNYTFSGKTYSGAQTISFPKESGFEELVPIAYTCAVAYTSGTAGTLTIAAGHTLTTGCIFDLYWLDATTGLPKFGRDCTAGTCSSVTTSITFTTDASTFGSTAIPAAGIAVAQACLQTSIACVVTGSNVGAIFASADQAAAIISLWVVAPTIELAVNILPNGCYAWLGVGTNPIASQAIVVANMSMNDITTPRNVRMAFGLTS